MYDDLADIRADIALRLGNAAAGRNLPMHVPAVVTSDVDVRGMVLRAFDEQAWTLRFHTDARAPKVAAIAADPRMAVLFYDKEAKIQIRVRGTGRVLLDGPLTDAAWAESTNFARRCYLGDAPGAASEAATSGLPAQFEGIEPDAAQLLPARENFAVVAIELVQLDWFYLAQSGHSRAVFSKAGEDWEARWVAP